MENAAANSWNTDYSTELRQRIDDMRFIANNPERIKPLLAYYRQNPIAWIEDWCITYDPRNDSPKPKIMPFVLFPRQKDFVKFLQSCLKDRSGGLVEKARDMGATWLCCAFSVWMWLFEPGAAIGWGSRKSDLVDKLGDPDSIFEKMRMIITHLPAWMLPQGFSPEKHATHMKILNPASGAIISGETGDNIGRGGRKKIYFKDESAHYERPEKIEAALSANTNVQIDISSVNGTGNVFHRRRKAGIIWEEGAIIPRGKVRVFIFDWRDNPLKTQEWYDETRQKYEDEGMPHVFAQEVDRNYSAAVQGVVIPAIWVEAAIDAHIKLNIPIVGAKIAAQDVADGGADKNALIMRQGILMQFADHWGGEASDAADKALPLCYAEGIQDLYYDCIGVGAGFKAQANFIMKGKTTPLKLHPWDAAGEVLNPEARIIPGDNKSPKNVDFYKNLKAQGWWALRVRFEKTYKMVTKGQAFPHDELISIPSGMRNRHSVVEELSQPVYKYSGDGRLIIDKSPNSSDSKKLSSNAIKSPNLADAVMMCYYPCKKFSILDAI